MALADIRREIVLSLALTNEAIDDARRALAEGADPEKVEAAGELNFLRRQKTMLEEQLRRIDQRLTGRNEWFVWLRQEWFSLMLHFEHWIAHG
jgi:hypothetical protein